MTTKRGADTREAAKIAARRRRLDSEEECRGYLIV
jgi:hypothetical protein